MPSDVGKIEEQRNIGSLWSWLLIAVLGVGLGWCVAGQTVVRAGGYEAGFWPDAWRYADTGLPMISSADGFLYMHWAQKAIEQGYAGMPPLSSLAALAAQLTSQPVEATAFYMSLLFNLGLGLLAAAWGRLLNAGRFCTFLACLVVVMMPAWLERAGPGQFDTDLAILFFWQTGLYFLVRATRTRQGSSERLRPLNLVFALIAFFFLSWFWTGSGLGLALASLALWFFLFLPCSVLGVKPRLILGALAAAWLLSLVLLPPDKAPAPAALLHLIHTRITLVFGLRPELFYSSIKELAPLSIWDLCEKIGGSAPGAILAVLACIAAAIRRPALRLPLLIALLCTASGLKVDRMAYLGTFPIALAVGFFPSIITSFNKSSQPSGRRISLAAAGFLLVAGVLYSLVNWAVTRDLDIRWVADHDRLLNAVRLSGENTEGARWWNWWDDGHFLAARSKNITPLFDGGSQTAVMAYIAARPFMLDDRRAAARWMRFFAIRGQGGLTPLIEIWGEDEAWEKLEAIFSDDESEYLAEIPGGKNWLYPSGRVYWYLPSTFFKISNWWIPLGTARQPDKALVRPHIEAIGRDQFLYDPDKKALTVAQSLWDKGYKNFGMVLNASRSPLAPPWPTDGAPYIVFSEKNPNAYIVDQLSIKTLPIYVMTPGEPELPNFRPVTVDYSWGGIWEILPE